MTCILKGPRVPKLRFDEDGNDFLPLLQGGVSVKEFGCQYAANCRASVKVMLVVLAIIMQFWSCLERSCFKNLCPSLDFQSIVGRGVSALQPAKHKKMAFPRCFGFIALKIYFIFSFVFIFIYYHFVNLTWGPCEAKVCWPATVMIAQCSKGQFYD